MIIGTLIWLSVGGAGQSISYYKTVAELGKMGDQAFTKRLRVGGDVEGGSIVRKGRQVEFTLLQDNARLKVVYEGTDPLPDTFRDGAQALADGKMARHRAGPTLAARRRPVRTPCARACTAARCRRAASSCAPAPAGRGASLRASPGRRW